MKKRNFLALVLALALTLGLAAPAMAAAPTEVQNGSASVDVEVVMNLPTIKVTISPDAKIIVNPYKLSYNVKVTGQAALGANDTIISTPALISSESTIPLEVKATPTGTSDTVTFANTSVVGESGKKVFLFLELKKATSDTGNFGITDWSTVADYDADTPAANHALILQGTTATATETIDAIENPGTPKFCAFKLIGDCSSTTPESWLSTDTLNVSIAFTFTPKPAPATPGP